MRQKTRRLLIASAKTIHVNENDDGEPVAEKKSGRKKKSKTVDDEEEEQPDEDEERDEERDVEEEEDDEVRKVNVGVKSFMVLNLALFRETMMTLRMRMRRMKKR